MNPPAIKVRNLTKTYTSPERVEILKGLSFSLEEGESLAIMGKSGEGKTTLLHILGSLDIPSSGEIEIGGVPIHSLSPATLRNQKLGFVFQNYNLLENYSLLENILLPVKIARLPTHPPSFHYQRALSLLHAVDLIDRAPFPAGKLSGGEKQRGAIARALILNPGLILADEPCGNLDSAHSQAIFSLFMNLTKQENKAVIIVTHDPELAVQCDRTLVLQGGLFSCAS